MPYLVASQVAELGDHRSAFDAVCDETVKFVVGMQRDVNGEV